MSAEDGTPFGRYRLVELLGRGGMGEVWRAHDTETDRIVAIKVLPANLSDDKDFQQRFRREAHAAARLNSPHVIPIHNYGEIDGRLYVDMRLIEGRDLGAVLADGPLEPGRAVRIIEQVAKALHDAHQVGLLHRDIKPSNILLDRDDFAYLIDFGIARVADETRMTKSGYMIGTFQYIAPERLDSGTEDARADIYSLACVLYECLTGSPPFDGTTMARLVAAHLSTPPPRPSINQPNVPPQADEVIATGMAKDPDERYATTIELADAARDAITTPIPRSHPVPPTAPVNQMQPDVHQGQGAPVAAFASPSGATHFHPATGPSSLGPLVGQSPSGQRNRRRIAWAGAAAVLAAIAVVLAVVLTTGSDRSNRPAAVPTSTAPPNTGPFTGVYRADFGASATYGKPDDGGTPSTGQWAVRSACRNTGCVATAAATGGPTLQPSFVLDDIGGEWHAVGTASVTSFPPDVTGFKGCAPGEYWTTITLQPRPDGTLGGQYRATGPPGCETERTITFTRTGDVDLNSLPDPASQPVRVASAAEAWHGRYRITHTPANTRFKAMSDDGTVQTTCLRTGERCVSVNHGHGTDVYNFANGKWIYTYDGNQNCSAGGSVPTKVYWELPLPQPTQDPITQMTGFGHRDIAGSGACAGSYNEALNVERTGD
ncbi:hypothetical protein A5791_17610 [Mycobacterium sp. 852002-51163_SCH5372311]|uniref:serine/threonine-protein kinase n=1 Tax=Mycobacterium sp. 852002-51163_SCH5372311 TaxID=1834097 RepID=UPI000800B7CD|nr:serine/threonine-protein kinase [Mycobacterium sp. 852002-51163_SCH5372311]OBF88485.1 hypothetical protein A5791_17610 [Mycobacterium sp. 852002-51163_SCH5372311]